MTRRVLLEVACGSAEDAVVAWENGADRVELNAALELGGLSPSAGTLIEARTISLPLIAMARPRPGGFVYTEREFRVLLRDAEFALGHGADGVAFGVLTADGEIDAGRCEQVVRLIGGREAVFHRAFDETPDAFAALEKLVDLGVKRVMTSGQEATAVVGTKRIADLVERARGRIEVMPACGIRADNVAELVTRTRCCQVHASLKSPRERRRAGRVSFDGYDATWTSPRKMESKLRVVLVVRPLEFLRR